MKIAMYWHNGRSLGHTSEVAKISKGLSEKLPNVKLLGVTGAFKGLDMVSKDMEIVKVPGFENFDTEDGLIFKNKFGVSRNELFDIRSKIINIAINAYQPNFFLVNHEPYGLDGELKQTLLDLKNCKKILTLRGVIYGAEETNFDYFSKETAEWINETYESILVHTDPEVFNLEEYYDIPKFLHNKIHYVGYLDTQSNVSKNDARKALGLENEERVFVSSMGGGQGCIKIWEQIVNAIKKNMHLWDKVILITGPYLEQKDYVRLCEAVKQESKVQVLRYSSNMKNWMKASNLFIGAAGANMLTEILSTQCNSIVIPRQISESEQLIHAGLLEKRKAVRMCTLEDIYQGKLDKMVREAMLSPINIENVNIKMGGANNYYKYLRL